MHLISRTDFRRRREKLGLTAEHLARVARVSVLAVNNLEV